MIGNKTIVGLVITTMVLSCVAVAVSADEGRVEPMGIFPGAITNTEIATGTVLPTNMLNTGNFIFGGVTANGAVIANDAVTLGSGDDAIAINPGTGALTVTGGTGALTVTGGTGGIDIGTTTGAITIDADGVSSNFNLASTGAGQDLTIGVTGDNDASLVLSSTGTGTDALNISTTAGGIDIAAVSTEAGEDLDIGISGVTGELRLTSASTGEDAISIQASAGGVDIDGANGVTVNATSSPISINGGTGAITLGGTAAIRTIAIGTDDAVQTINIGTGTEANAIGIGGSASTTTFEGTVVMPSGSAVAHLLNYTDANVSVTGTTYANANEVLNTSTGSDDITTQGTKNFLITYSANTIVSNDELIITNISVLNGATHAVLNTSTQTNITFADCYATYLQNTIQVFVEDVVQADNMDIVVRARKTDDAAEVYVQNQTLTVIAI